ncbi:MAG: glycosyltransferase family 4 protein [Paraclostridium sp.]|uniref:glycosyltransferase family 4 protein n=1 Tax=Paraclostridium sp. TaxID=2023273 RepID=UPI003F3D07A4
MKKVFQIGPDMNLKGGIATVIRQISLSEKLNKKYDQVFISSTNDTNKLITYLKCIITVLFIKKGSIVHIHVASNGSFIRKYILFKLLRNKTKKIVHIHGGNFINYYRKSNKLLKLCITDMINQANSVISVSDYMINELKSEFSNYDYKFAKVYNGIKLENKKIRYEDKQNIILYMGKIVTYKGIYDLITAINYIKDVFVDNNWKVVIAGNGEIDKILSIIKQNELSEIIEIAGWVDGKNKKKLLKDSKITVVPSHIESFGISAVEAMAYGNAIIATDVGALPELITESENGFIINKSDCIELGNKIKFLIKNEKLIETMCFKNIKHSQNFSDELMFEMIMEIYGNL